MLLGRGRANVGILYQHNERIMETNEAATPINIDRSINQPTNRPTDCRCSAATDRYLSLAQNRDRRRDRPYKQRGKEDGVAGHMTGEWENGCRLTHFGRSTINFRKTMSFPNNS